MSQELKTSFLAQIPLVAEAAEKGLTVYNQSEIQVVHAFEKVAEGLAYQMAAI